MTRIACSLAGAIACATLTACAGTWAGRGSLELSFEAHARPVGAGQVQVISLSPSAGDFHPVDPLPVALALRLTRHGFPAQVELFEPPPSQSVRSGPGWIRIAGRVSGETLPPSDLLIGLDQSTSAFFPSGADLDGDGIAGAFPEHPHVRADAARRNPRRWSTDPEDSGFELSRALARRIIRSLAAHDVRIGLFSFGKRTRLRARLGSPERALRALDSLPLPPKPQGTDLALAIENGERMLERWSEPGRRKILMVISDGFATRPGPPLLAHRSARSALDGVVAGGISFYWVLVGTDVASEPTLLADLITSVHAAPSWGALRSLFVDLPVDPLEALPEKVEIANETSGERGRALRFRADGRFDALLQLVPGDNQVSIRTRASSGQSAGVTRTVRFEPAPDLVGLEGFLELLRGRSRHIAATLPPPRALEKRLEIRAVER